MALELFYNKVVGVAAASYKKMLALELNKIGARYEDLMIDEPDVVETLKLADPEVMHGRMRRLKRASDLVYKGKNLPDYAPNMILEPFKEEFYADLLKLRKRDEEYEMLNLHKK